MACGATLKRSHEWDPLMSPGCSPKRLCLPGELMSSRRSLNIGNTASQRYSSATTWCSSPTSDHLSGICQTSQTCTSSSILASSCGVQSLFYTGRGTNLSTHKSDISTVSSVLGGGHASPAGKYRESTALPQHSRSSVLSTRSVSSETLLTQSQVSAICRLMVEEHESTCRERFNQLLHDKLAEQYESFLQFNHEQLKRKFSSADASYVS